MKIVGKTSDGQAFWSWLESNTARIQSHAGQDVQSMADEIRRVFTSAYPGLVWQINEEGSRPWTFCVSADGNRELFPAVVQAVHAAPDLPGWVVRAFRPPGSLDVVLRIGERTLKYEDIWCSVRPATNGVDITLHIRGLSAETDQALGQAAVLLLDNAVGEYDGAMKIASLDRAPLVPAPVRRADYFPLSELPRYLDGITQSLDSG